MNRYSEDRKVGPDLESRLRRIDSLLADGNEAVFVDGEVITGLSRGMSAEGGMQVLLIRAQHGQGVSRFVLELASNTIVGSDNEIPGSQYDFDKLLADLSRTQCPQDEEATVVALCELHLHVVGRPFKRTGRPAPGPIDTFFFGDGGTTGKPN